MKKKLLFLSLTIFLTACMPKTYSGSFSSSHEVIDDYFGVKTNKHILYRDVQMVQYSKNDNTVDLVLSNYPIDPFDEYTNPEFKYESKVFYSDLRFNDMELSYELVNAIANDESVKKVKTVECPDEIVNNEELHIYDESLVSLGNDWKVGDYVITFYEIDLSGLFELNAINKKNILNYSNDFSIIKK